MLTIGSLCSGYGAARARIPFDYGKIVGEAGRRANVPRPLTRSLDLGEEGLAMKATQSSDPHA